MWQGVRLIARPLLVACTCVLASVNPAPSSAQNTDRLPFVLSTQVGSPPLPRRLPQVALANPRTEANTAVQADTRKSAAPPESGDQQAAAIIDEPSPDPDSGRVEAPPDEMIELSPPGFFPEETLEVRENWWDGAVAGPLLTGDSWVSFDLETLLIDALQSSPRVIGLGLQAETGWAEVVQANAAFDARILSESRYGRTSDPVGNSLITGGPPLLRESNWTSRFGLRRTTRYGGQLDASQQLGLLDSNSAFFLPANQGNARMAISLTQPLLAGAGRLYTERLILQAHLDADANWHEMLGDVQASLAELMMAYWQLYYERCRLVQQQDLLQRGLTVQRLVEQRSDFDTGRIERLRVQEQVARRRARLVRIETDMRNQQAQLALLVGSPQLASLSINELIPRERPSCPPTVIDRHEATVTGLHHRPGISIAAAELEAAALDVKVTRNQLLPQLNAIVDTYVAGLNGNSDIGQSFLDQFGEGQPGFTAGVQYEFPMGRRGARAVHRAAHAKLRRKMEEMRQAVLMARTEIDVAVRELTAAASLMQSRQQTLEATVAEEHYLERRWKLLGGEGASVGLVLEDLLDAQQGRTDAEKDVVAARVEYLQALVRLQVAMGTLLIKESIEPVSQDSDLGVRFERQARRSLDAQQSQNDAMAR